MLLLTLLPKSFFDEFILIPVLNLAVSLLRLVVPSGSFTWFSPWPLRTALVLVVLCFIMFLAMFKGFLWAIRNPVVIGRVNKLSIRFSRSTLLSMPAPTEVPPEATKYPLAIEIASYLSLATATVAFLAAAITARLPHDVYIVSKIGQSQIADAAFDLRRAWVTGAPRDRAGDLLAALVGTAILVLLGAVAIFCSRNANEAELRRRRMSMYLGNATNNPNALAKMMEVGRLANMEEDQTTDEEEVVELVEKGHTHR